MKKKSKFAVISAILTLLLSLVGISLFLVSISLGNDFMTVLGDLFKSVGTAFNFTMWNDGAVVADPNFWINISIFGVCAIMLIVDIVWLVLIGKKKKPSHLFHFFSANIALFTFIVYGANFNAVDVLSSFTTPDVMMIIATVCMGLAVILFVMSVIASIAALAKVNKEDAVSEDGAVEYVESESIEYQRTSVTKTIVIEEEYEETVPQPQKEASSTVIINNYYGDGKNGKAPAAPSGSSGLSQGVQTALDIDSSIKKSNKKD